MEKIDHVPVRTCIGCRGTSDRSSLLRIVLHTGTPVTRVVPDERARQPGRGAWLHPHTSCLEQAVRRRAFGRAFRTGEALDIEPLTEWIKQHDPVADATGADRTESGFDADEHPMSTHR